MAGFTAAASTISRSIFVAPHENLPEHLTLFQVGSPTRRGSRASRCSPFSTGPALSFYMNQTPRRRTCSSGRPSRSRRGRPLCHLGWGALATPLCKEPRSAERPTLPHGGALTGSSSLMSWGYNEVVHGAGALLHLGAFHRDDHVGQRVSRHHSEPEGRGWRTSRAGRKTPRRKYRKDRQAQVDPQQTNLTLPVIFLMLSNPLPARLSAPNWAWLIAGAGVSHGRHDPALFQLAARPRGQPALDLGRHGR